ncbi:MAG: biopolymer transporter ExbD [Candidatus Pseudobacter hemicellulosilyticus]|uniref:Biopolymer transporter ExbD n=1 Tax=Candidatus Pseudobacter hemicellulosilyticus TaxID=3121375 RepID=A0AAJ5WT36_9BACT|nr:MAG: biopolymer transporter ExbD [Pseudobacter sp.]
MPKVKVPRKSTNVDMTAMCDVAFLLLSFFILTTKFKPSEALEVTTPKSVSTKAVDAQNVVLITMDKDGKVYFSVGDENADEKDQILDLVSNTKNLQLGEPEKAAFRRSASFIGVPFSQLKSFLQLTPEQLKSFKSPGIPIDSANNELQLWMGAANTAFQGKKMALMVKGDNNAKFPTFKGVIDAFKKNEIFKFSMITDPEGVPEGTDLYRTNQRSGGKAAETE